jgi:CRISPR/Cas system-associated exonuclease Cas4 (RecB family)
MDRMASGMPRRELVLCRGFRGVVSFATLGSRKLLENDPFSPARSLVVVPTVAAAHLFRRELEDALLSRRSAALLPTIATSADLLGVLAERASTKPRRVDPLLREALLESAFQKVQEAGILPPFGVRGGLAGRVLDLYDEILAKSPLAGSGGGIDRFFARALEELEAPDDEGAMKLAAQTRFLRASLEEYRTVLSGLGLLDVPSLRRALTAEPFPFERAFVLGSETLGVADLDLLSQAPALEELFVAVSSPLNELPEPLARRFSVSRAADAEATPDSPPRLLTPGREDALAFVARDREEAFTDAARLLKTLEDDGRLPPLHRIGIVVPRPLPYLYLAKKILSEAGVPYQLQDSFPLATEPYVAAVDDVLELVAADAHRDAALALLRSPFFEFEGVEDVEVAAFDELTLRFREPGGAERFRALLSRLSRKPLQPNLPGVEGPDASARAIPALAAIVRSIEELGSLSEPGPLTAKIDCLRRYLDAHGRSLPAEDSRTNRARAAFHSILAKLDSAARLVSDPPREFTDLREKLRRAVERHTFDVRSGETGVQIVDARSAPFGGFDLVVLMGLNEEEWPARSPRNIFYPQWLLREFGFPSDRDLLAAERQHFLGLLELARKNVVLFRHQLEDEIPAVPSPFLDDVRSWTIERKVKRTPLGTALGEIVVTRSEALRRGLLSSERGTEPRRPGLVEGPLALSEPISPTSFELYLRCPFKYYSHYLLGLEEEEDVEAQLSPLERGKILHEILHEGFAEWDRGRGSPREIAPETYDEALALFRRTALSHIPPEHRAIEMERLFGGAGEPGAIPWLLRREMAQGPLRERLVEHAFSSPLRLDEGPRGEKPWYLRVQGRIDRADIDEKGHLHVYDYKSGRAPADEIALQVPLYAMCLSAERGAPVKEAAYLSFRDRRAVSRGDFEKASALLSRTYGRIRQGSFAPSPYREHLCGSCGFALVCRKEIVEPLEPSP